LGIKAKLGLIFTLFILLYFSTFIDLINAWTSNEDYGHGFLILPVSLFLIWRRRSELLGLTIKPSGWGIIMMILWGVSYAVGIIGHISTIAELSMLIFLLGAFAVLISGQAARVVLFPVLFLIFMFPIPSAIYSRITNPLLLIYTTISFNLLNMLHVPVLQEGNLITLPNYTMEVVRACSGIRSLVSIMALASIMGYLMTPSNLFRFVFLLISIPIAMLGNVVRISSTALLAYFISPQSAEGFSHTMAGIVSFMFSFILVYICMELILWSSRKRKQSSSS